MPAYVRVPVSWALRLLPEDVDALRGARTELEWYHLVARLWGQAEPDAYALFRQALAKVIPPPDGTKARP